MERAQFWKGIAIGVGGTILTAVLIMFISMTVMGACAPWARDGMCPMSGAANEDRPADRGMAA